MYAMGAFIAIIALFMVMRSFGIGPFGSLAAAGELKRADRVLIAESIPHGATGKILKTELRKIYAAPPA